MGDGGPSGGTVQGMTQVRNESGKTRASAPTDAPPPRGGWRTLVHWFGIACLMVAAGFAGYIAWSLWGTGLHTAEAQDRLRTEFQEELRAEPVEPTAETLVPLGGAYAQLLIPAIDVNFMVVQGTGYEDLKDGPGHYPDTADPWDDSGRVGIAGHRTTYQAPFFDLEKLQRGDEVVVRTRYGTYRYEVDRVFVIPSGGSGRVLAQTPRPTLVLTTCNPKYSSSERLIVTARRVETSQWSGGPSNGDGVRMGTWSASPSATSAISSSVKGSGAPGERTATTSSSPVASATRIRVLARHRPSLPGTADITPTRSCREAST